MEFPEGLKYSKEHEWVLVEGNTATIGITGVRPRRTRRHRLRRTAGGWREIVKDDPFGAVESVKAVSDIYAPVSGTVSGDQRCVTRQSGDN